MSKRNPIHRCREQIRSCQRGGDGAEMGEGDQKAQTSHWKVSRGGVVYSTVPTVSNAPHCKFESR